MIVQARRARRLDLAVEYVVDGVSYTTGQVSALGDPRALYYAGRTLGRMRRRFAPGARVPVHYDPASPGDALLLRVEAGKLLLAGFFTLLFTVAAPLIRWAGVTVMEPTRLREAKAIQALERQAPPVLAYLRAHPELGQAQHARGFSVGWPHNAPDTALTGNGRTAWRRRRDITSCAPSGSGRRGDAAGEPERRSAVAPRREADGRDVSGLGK